jgi:RHS repeat-associated protein
VALLVYGHAEQAQNRQAQSAQRFAIHGDHLGTPQAITDSAQRVVWLARYDTFGKATAQALPNSEVTAQNRSKSQGWMGTAHAAAQTGAEPDKPFEFHLRFAGQYEDSETGWHYNWHRFYDPQTGRYLTPDPIGLKGGDNAYGYAGGDPLGAVDPSGLYTVYWGGAGLDGPYIADQVRQLENAGISNISIGGGGNGNTILDAANVLTVRYQGDGGRFFDADPEGRKIMCPEQTNYIGYSYGSLLAAHTALYWANQGRVIDNVALIGSPIDGAFLTALRSHANIRNVLIYDLTLYGDPIRAGMSLLELTASAPLLGIQIAQSPRSGHFYYNPDDDATSNIGIERRGSLANNLARNGLR